MGDYKIQSFVTLEREGERETTKEASKLRTPLITNTRAPPCHDPPHHPPSLLHSYTNTHTHTHVNPPPPVPTLPYKVDPNYPPSQTCSALSTSSGQHQTKKPETRGVSATWLGSANPLILALSFLLSPSFLCPQRKKRKNCNFFLAC